MSNTNQKAMYMIKKNSKMYIAKNKIYKIPLLNLQINSSLRY